MKLVLLSIAGAKEGWVEEAIALYQKKIGHFVQFEEVQLKAEKHSRDQDLVKKKKDSEKLINWLDLKDYVIGFSEQGQKFKGSVEFSVSLIQALSRNQRLVLMIGGPFGLNEAAQARCQQLWSLSVLTFSHQVARVVAAEQIYRALMIHNRRAYHNE